jgi:hypothetical protein
MAAIDAADGDGVTNIGCNMETEMELETRHPLQNNVATL